MNDMRSYNDYRIYYSLITLMRAKASSQSKKGLKDIGHAIKDISDYFHSFKDIRLLKYLYCYLYKNFDDDSLSIDISVEVGDRISIITSSVNEDGKIRYDIDLLSVVEDEELPIKRENCVIEMDRNNKKAVLSRQVSYNTDTAMEMVVLDGDPNTVDVDRVVSLFEESTNLKSSKMSFRSFVDPLLITEIDISKDPVVNHYVGSIDRFDRIIKDRKTDIDEYNKKTCSLLYRELRDKLTHNRLDYSEYFFEDTLPYLYAVIPTLVSEKDYGFNNNYDYSIDNEVIDFIDDEKIIDFTGEYKNIMDYIESKKNDKKRGLK